MIISGTLLQPASGPEARLVEGWIRVDRDQIAEVQEGSPPSAPDLGGNAGDYLILPGLIDTHCHLPQFDLIGAHGLGLLDWLERVVFPAEARWHEPAHARRVTERVVDQLFAYGTTSICAYATVHPEGARAALEVCRQRGIRALVGPVLMDCNAPADLLRPPESLLDETRRLLDDFGVGGRTAVAVTPRFAVTCSAELLSGAGQLAAEYGAFVQTHLAETIDECERVRELHGAPYAEVYAKAGLLSPRTLLGHGIHLDDHELAILGDREAVIVHCPTSNSFLGSGVFDRARSREAGVRGALGSDIGGGYERSMVRVARAMVEAASSTGGTPVTSAEAWWQITAGNADALGDEAIGRLTPGSAADVLVVRPLIPWLDAPDPLGALLFGWDDRWLETTLCGGRQVYVVERGAAG